MSGSPTLQYKLDHLLTVEQLARRLAVSVRTVLDWIARRRIPFTRFQRRVYFHAGVIEQMLQRSQVSALTAVPRPTLAEQGGAQTRETKK